jgi:cytoskeletal protein RodZ
MSHFNKKLVITAAAATLTAVLGVAVAQTANRPDDASATQQVEVNGPPADHEIYFFRDQGNSPETDPAAHLLLIKHQAAPVPVAQDTTTTTTTTTVAQADPAPAPAPMATTTDNSAAATTTDTTAMPADNQEPVLAPKADRN